MTPPHDLAAERALLGSILLGTDYRPAVAAMVRADDFYGDGHAAIWKCIHALDAEGAHVDGVTLADRLTREGRFEAVGGQAYLHTLFEAVPSVHNAEAYAEVVRDRALRRFLATASDHMSQSAHDLTLTVADTLEQARTDLGAVAARMSGRQLFDLEAAVEDAVASLQDDDDTRRRWSTGIPVLNREVGGFAPGQHWVIGGKSQHGKTALACNMMLACLTEGGTALMCRYEETARQVLMRLASLTSGIAYSEANLRRLSVYDAQRYTDALRALGDHFTGRLHILCGATLPDIEAAVADLRPWLVVYDTLQAMALQLADSSTRHDLHVGRVCGFASRLCLAHQHAAVLLSQLSKATSGLPDMNALRESGAIEEAADAAVLCWWPYVEMGDTVARDRIVLRVGKNRIGGLCRRTVSKIRPSTQLVGEPLPRDEAAAFLDPIT